MKSLMLISDPGATLDLAGGKGASLAHLAASGLPVPKGFIIPTTVYRQLATNHVIQETINLALAHLDMNDLPALEEVAKQIQKPFLEVELGTDLEYEIRAEYDSLFPEDRPVAVRSSATAEDLSGASFAGQQDTYLNIRGSNEVLSAVRRCFASLWNSRAIAYRARRGIHHSSVAMAVVVQELINAEAAGVLFTADPLSGKREHLLVNAAWGLGESVVSGKVTPDTFTLKKSTGRIEERRIAEKEVMTICTEMGTSEISVPESMRSEVSISDITLSQLACLGKQVEVLYQTPIDMEWAYAEGKVYILQARPITSLKKSTSEIEWPVPDPKGHWARGSFIDFMPDPLTPLFESMLLHTYREAMPRIMGYFHMGEIDIYRNYLTTFNHFPYMQVKFTARQWLQLMFRLLPAIKPFLMKSLPLWQDEILPAYRQIASFWQEANLGGRMSAAILAGVDEVFSAAMDNLSAVQVATLGGAAGTEALFTFFYNKLIRRKEDPPAPAFLMGYASKPIRSEQVLFDLAQWCQEIPVLAEYLTSSPTGDILTNIRSKQAPAGIDVSVWAKWTRVFQKYLAEYGYAIYNLDFGRPLPIDDPAPILEALRLFLSGKGKNPYERQNSAVIARKEAMQTVGSRVRGIKGWVFRKTLTLAQKYAPLREDSIAELGLGFPAIRRLLLELGRRFKNAGAIREMEDIYWLSRNETGEAAAAIDNGSTPRDYSLTVKARKDEWQMLSHIVPPTQLPAKKKILWMEADMFSGSTTENISETIINGIAASPGVASGTARVLKTPEDFAQMRPGEVLVSPITTPAWTPLFVMACAVVTDIGGPLSHGSIVAREYGIPAVLGTRIATQRICNGQWVTVDGSMGLVRLGEQDN